MTRATKQRGRAAQRTQPSASYVYGVVPSDTDVTGQASGLGDPPAAISLVASGDVAAIVSDIDLGRPLGTPEDLIAHQRLLDDVAAAAVPVLPLRFGAVVSSRDAVAREMLAEHHDEFAARLADLEGMAEFIVRGRYDERALLTSVIEGIAEAAGLASQIRGTSEDETRPQRIRLGELLNAAIEQRRQSDTDHLARSLERLCTAMTVLDPTHEQDAVHIAVLTRLDRQGDLERAVHQVATDWQDQVTFRLLGPLAPYDFVGASVPAIT